MIGYIRVSDSRKADGESQREAIKAYANKRGIFISDWIEEHVSASKTELSDRKLSSLIASQQSIIVSDITRLGRSKVMELVGAIGQIASYGELHLAYNDTLINAKNADNAEIIFTVIGESFASAVEAQKRSERAKAGHAKRQAKGLPSGRQKGQKVKSKLDEHTAYILNLIDNNTSKAGILRKLKERGVSISRSRFYSWLEARGLHNKKAEFQTDMFLEQV
ncbi:recombinase family protein [uncultured Vibrio sp.]|uniref:recombinase family protein n=1 Tax=uncultured Vibrio sp. TaxID=114054 RepID=UPI002634D3CE|nr:recombinase family protein [uncultured Vibrio sp.]